MTRTKAHRDCQWQLSCGVTQSELELEREPEPGPAEQTWPGVTDRGVDSGPGLSPRDSEARWCLSADLQPDSQSDGAGGGRGRTSLRVMGGVGPAWGH